MRGDGRGTARTARADDAAALFDRVVLAVVAAVVAQLIVSVLDAPARSGHGLFKGVASNHLGGHRAGGS